MTEFDALIEQFPDAIAVIGMAGRFPKADGVGEYWSILAEGRECIERLGGAEPPPAGERPHHVPAKAVLDGPELFDAEFFGFSAREAEITDPQHRVFLECAWHALEDAGFDPQGAGAVGVFAGAGPNTYLWRNLQGSGQLSDPLAAFQGVIHNKNDHLSTRTAYKLGLTGPAVTVQTACSTSLVAVHLACESLLSYGCDVALAGGSTIALPQDEGYQFHPGGIGSPDGRCRPFDAEARGTVPGSGAGVVCLKRLADAIRDGDRVHAVILGSAVNNDGADKVGYTAPSVAGQTAVIRLAHRAAGIEPATISLVEAHGTATPLGDPIEVRALAQAFGEGLPPGSCSLGSVKGNLGHLDTAAGVAGLIKAVLCLKHRKLAPSLNYRAPNPQIAFERTPFAVNAELRDWNPAVGVRRAAVSSFGIGGTNAHAVLQEAPAPEPLPVEEVPILFAISAKSETALEALTAAWARHLAEGAISNLPNLSYNLLARRRSFDYRRSLVGRTVDDIRRQLETVDPVQVVSRYQPAADRAVTFLFSGQGSQYPGMAEGLLAGCPAFAREFEACRQVLRDVAGLDVLAAIREEGGRSINETELAQPALFCVEYAVARTWMGWGVEPACLVGHSVGELAAACLAGVFSLPDALRLVAIRGRAMQKAPPGSMLAVHLSAEAVGPYLGRGVDLAAVNAPELCAVSGPTERLKELEADLVRAGVQVQRLHTSHAFHSAMMDEAAREFGEAVAGVSKYAPRIPVLSTLTGAPLTDEEATSAAYWARQLREPVRYEPAVARLLENPNAVLLEVGPGSALRTLARWHHAKKPEQIMVTSLPSPAERAKRCDRTHLLHAVGALWNARVEVRPEAFLEGASRRAVEMPPYPFQRQPYWIEPDARAAAGLAAAPRRDDVRDRIYLPVWEEARVEEADPGIRTVWVASHGDEGAALAAALARRPGLVVATVDLAGLDEANAPARLAEALARAGWPDRIAYLAPRRAGACLESAAAEASGAFAKALAFCQALALQGEEPCGLAFVTRAMEAFDPGDGCPEQAALWGLARVLPQEHRTFSARVVDLDRGFDWSRARPVSALVADLLGPAPGAPGAELRDHQLTVHRRGVRWRRRLEPAIPRAEPGLAVRPGGHYVVTGGTGGIGREVVRRLLSTERVSVTVLSRRPDAALGSWLREAAQGSGVDVVACDVSDAAAVRDAIARAEVGFGPVAGVFHLAGVPGAGMIATKRQEAAGAVFAPKVLGLAHLAGALRANPDAFLVLFSSLTTVVGRFGQSDYTAANAAMAALGERLRAEGRRVLTVNWGAWEEVGMAARGLASRREGALPALRRLDHPLLQEVIEEGPERTVFRTRFDVGVHWVLDEHRIFGHPIVPGVCYFEMVRAAYGPVEAGEHYELRDVFFLAPLRVQDGSVREARLELEAGPASTGFSVKAQVLDEAGAVRDRSYCVGTIRRGRGEPPRTYDLDAIRRRCSRKQFELPSEAREEDLGPRWHSVKWVAIGEDEVLLELDLPDAFAGDFDRFFFHPALLDRAAGMAKNFLANDDHYIPLNYRHVNIYRPLEPRIFSHARFHRGEDPSLGTITFDILLLNERGECLVEIQRFTQKRVDDPGQELKGMADHEVYVDTPLPGAREPYGERGIRPDEGVRALDLLLAGSPERPVTVPAADLAAVIRDADALMLKRLEKLAARPEAGAARRGRPNLKTPFQAPATEVERRIAAAWEAVLGLDGVGVHDNFFELGGDSVQAIQIISRAGEQGVQLSTQQFFQYSTIAELARMIEEVLAERRAQGSGTCRLPFASEPAGTEALRPLAVPVAGGASLPDAEVARLCRTLADGLPALRARIEGDRLALDVSPEAFEARILAGLQGEAGEGAAFAVKRGEGGLVLRFDPRAFDPWSADAVALVLAHEAAGLKGDVQRPDGFAWLAWAKAREAEDAQPAEPIAVGVTPRPPVLPLGGAGPDAMACASLPVHADDAAALREAARRARVDAEAVAFALFAGSLQRWLDRDDLALVWLLSLRGEEGFAPLSRAAGNLLAPIPIRLEERLDGASLDWLKRRIEAARAVRFSTADTDGLSPAALAGIRLAFSAQTGETGRAAAAPGNLLLGRSPGVEGRFVQGEAGIELHVLGRGIDPAALEGLAGLWRDGASLLAAEAPRAKRSFAAADFPLANLNEAGMSKLADLLKRRNA